MWLHIGHGNIRFFFIGISLWFLFMHTNKIIQQCCKRGECRMYLRSLQLLNLLPPPQSLCTIDFQAFWKVLPFPLRGSCRYNLALPEKMTEIPAFSMQEWKICGTRKFQRVYADPKQQIIEKGCSFYAGLCLRCFKLSVCFSWLEQLLTTKVAELATPGRGLHPKKHWCIFWCRQPLIYGEPCVLSQTNTNCRQNRQGHFWNH